MAIPNQAVMNANKVPETIQINDALTTEPQPKKDVKVNEVAIEISRATPKMRRHEIRSKLSSEEILDTIQGSKIKIIRVPSRPVLTLAIATGLIA